MPSWMIHMNVAKRTINGLAGNASFASVLGTTGPTTADINRIATNNPAYFALGSIGPDLFVFLPDFKGEMGGHIYKIAKFMEDLYNKIDPYIAAYEDTLGPILDQGNSELNALTGGMLNSITGVSKQLTDILITGLEDFVSDQYDWFSLMTSGVPAGSDEQSFFWSDMLHYRRTYEFAARLWKNAQTDQEKAYALGWMTHVGTDVTGHSFVNQKCGGPFRLHAQRHHAIETHMDAHVYDSEFGGQSIYQSLCGSAQHLWIAFDDNGTPLPDSHSDFFQPQTRPIFDPSDKQALKAAWDVDSSLPEGIQNLLVQTLRDTYPDIGVAPNHQTPDIQDQCADHPYNLAGDGFPNAGDLSTTYFYLYKYVKLYSTDFYKLQPPSAPPVIPWPDFPSPPGTPENNGASDGSLSLWDSILDILSWIIYIGECLLYLPAVLAALVLGPTTYYIRDFIYQYIELPLYNVWLSLRWLLSITGYATPLPGAITPALHTLGQGFSDNWTFLEVELNDLSGGLLGTSPSAGSEPSGNDFDMRRDGYYPLDAVTDPNRAIPAIPNQLISLFDNSEGYSEFTRPWRWPGMDNEGDRILTERPHVMASPYISGQSALNLMMDVPGDDGFRKKLESAGNADETRQTVHDYVLQGKTLGDPADYSSYVIGKLTRDDVLDDPKKIVNFNLDADRGYGFKCWDWSRDEKIEGALDAYRDATKTSQGASHIYSAPKSAGTGWVRGDVLNGVSPPHQHNPWELNGDVIIRYIDKEGKFN